MNENMEPLLGYITTLEGARKILPRARLIEVRWSSVRGDRVNSEMQYYLIVLFSYQGTEMVHMIHALPSPPPDRSSFFVAKGEQA